MVLLGLTVSLALSPCSLTLARGKHQLLPLPLSKMINYAVLIIPVESSNQAQK
jgi:hypothetical protein